MAGNDIIKSYVPKWLCIFLIDVSSSMSWKDLSNINMELNNFHQRIKDDNEIELCIAVFDETVRFVLEPKGATKLDSVPSIMPQKRVEKYPSNIYCALSEGQKKKAERIRWYEKTRHPYYRPCVVMLTNKATEEMYHGKDYEYLKFDTSSYRYDYLFWGLHSSSLYAGAFSNKVIRMGLMPVGCLSQVLLGIYYNANRDIGLSNKSTNNDVSWMDTILAGLFDGNDGNYKKNNSENNIELEAFDI